MMDTPQKPFRLVLTPEQSAAMAESGLQFAAGAPCDLRAVSGRAAILLFECDKATADAACGVVIGTHKAVRIRTPKPPTP